MNGNLNLPSRIIVAFAWKPHICILAWTWPCFGDLTVSCYCVMKTPKTILQQKCQYCKSLVRNGTWMSDRRKRVTKESKTKESRGEKMKKDEWRKRRTDSKELRKKRKKERTKERKKECETRKGKVRDDMVEGGEMSDTNALRQIWCMQTSFLGQYDETMLENLQSPLATHAQTDGCLVAWIERHIKATNKKP